MSYLDEKCALCQWKCSPLFMCYKEECKNHSWFHEVDKLDEVGLALIRKYIVENIMTNDDIMLNEDARDYVDLPSVIASLYEVIHRIVMKEPYDYMFHWANKVGSNVDDDYFIGDKE